MTERTAKLLRLLTILALVAAGGLAVRLALVLGDDSDAGFTLPEADDAYTVVDALAVAGADPIPVRGYVFEGDARELRLCSTRTDRDGGGPPRCVGPYLSLEGIDRGSLDLEQGEAELGTVWWSDDPVNLYGTLNGTVMQVQVVLR